MNKRRKTVLAGRTRQKTSETHEYPREVIAGRYVVCRYVRLACERHLRDLESGHERGLWFDEEAAQLAIDFFRLLRLSKGRWAGKPFDPEPWQRFFIGSAYGWKRADGTRRFRSVHLEVARKNGKTETAAGFALKQLVADGEQGAEVYCIATKRDQAKLTFDIAKKMIAKSTLRRHLRPKVFTIVHEASGSKLDPLSSDSHSLDGLNISCAIRDELHAWKGHELWDVIETATGARDQPLGISTTTAGTNRQSVWWEQRELVIKMLEQKDGFDDDGLFGLIYTLDDDDEWQDERCWIKANPNLNVTLKIEDLRAECRKAIRNPGYTNNFRRLRLNQPTESVTKWLGAGLIQKAWEDYDEENLHGRICYGGLDLSQTLDLTAWALVFPPTDHDTNWRLVIRHFMPGADIREKEERDGFPYSRHADGKVLTLTEGDWVDYELVKSRIYRDAESFRLVSLAYDRRFAPAIIQHLIAEGIECVPWTQTFGGLTTGTKEFKRLLHARLLKIPKCPIIEWETENVSIEVDNAGNERPHKGKSTGRIDGIVAAINSLSLANHKYGSEEPEAGVLEIDAYEQLLGGFS